MSTFSCLNDRLDHSVHISFKCHAEFWFDCGQYAKKTFEQFLLVSPLCGSVLAQYICLLGHPIISISPLCGSMAQYICLLIVRWSWLVNASFDNIYTCFPPSSPPPFPISPSFPRGIDPPSSNIYLLCRKPVVLLWFNLDLIDFRSKRESRR